MSTSVVDTTQPTGSQVLWSQCKAKLEFISSVGILESELVCVNFFTYESGCSVTPSCFLRLADRFGVTSVQQVAYGDDVLFFLEQGVEFRTVLSAEDMRRYSAELNAFQIVRNEL